MLFKKASRQCLVQYHFRNYSSMSIYLYSNVFTADEMFYFTHVCVHIRYAFLLEADDMSMTYSLYTNICSQLIIWQWHILSIRICVPIWWYFNCMFNLYIPMCVHSRDDILYVKVMFNLYAYVFTSEDMSMACLI